MKTIITGDIHGCFQEFLALLKKTGLEEATDRLILLGDAMDRGPDSWQVFQETLRLKSVMKDRLVYLMGNHEDMAVDAYQSGDRQLWNQNGGGVTRKSFYKHGDRLQKYVSYLEKLPLYYETEHYICVHAGLTAGDPGETDRDTFLWDRTIARGYTPYDGKLLIYGHTPMKAVIYRDGTGNVLALPQMPAYETLPETGSICLDTGCVFGGTLSAMVIEEETQQFRIVKVSGAGENNKRTDRTRTEI